MIGEVAHKRKGKGMKKAPQRGRFLRVRTAGIRVLNQCAFAILVLLGCSAVALLSVPQVKELKRLEADEEFAKQEELRARAQYDKKARELDAIRENPEYLETIARDRLNLHRAGETIIRVVHDNKTL